jgi:hypothetical protein
VKYMASTLISREPSALSVVFFAATLPMSAVLGSNPPRPMESHAQVTSHRCGMSDDEVYTPWQACKSSGRMKMGENGIFHCASHSWVSNILTLNVSEQLSCLLWYRTFPFCCLFSYEFYGCSFRQRRRSPGPPSCSDACVDKRFAACVQRHVRLSEDFFQRNSRLSTVPRTLSRWLLRGPFEKFVDSPNYSES